VGGELAVTAALERIHFVEGIVVGLEQHRMACALDNPETRIPPALARDCSAERRFERVDGAVIFHGDSRDESVLNA